MENCLEAKNSVVGKEDMSPFIAVVNNNVNYNFGFVGSMAPLGESPLKPSHDLKPLRKKRVGGRPAVETQRWDTSNF